MLIVPFWGLWGFTCAQTNTDSLLCRSWQIDWQATYQAMGAENQNKFLALSSAQQIAIEQALSSQEYLFHFDGSLLLIWQTQDGLRKQQLTWEVTGSRLIIKHQEQIKYKNIILLNDTKLILSILNGTELFPILHLKPKL